VSDRLTAYCINLARRKDRWQHTQNLADQHGFTLERVDAVDAQDPANAPLLAAMKPTGPTGRLGIGTLACTLSHTKAWKAFLASGHDRALIIEDNLILAQDFTPVALALLADPQTGGLIKLQGGGVIDAGVLLSRKSILCAGHQVHQAYHLIPSSKAYIIDRQVAELAVQRVGNCDVGVDHFMFYPRRRRGSLGVAFSILAPPTVMAEKDLSSDIAGHRYIGKRIHRDMRRFGYEAAQIPMMLGKFLTGQASIQKPRFVKAPK